MRKVAMAGIPIAALFCGCAGGNAPDEITTRQASLVVSSVTVTLTRLYIGRFADMGYYRASVTIGGSLDSMRSIWDCPRDPQEGFGDFIPYPEGQSSDSTCDPPNSVFTGQDIAALAPYPDRTVYTFQTPANIGPKIPVQISFFHPTELLLNFKWQLDVDSATGAVSFAPTQGGVTAETHGTSSCARGVDDWMLCWEITTGAPGPGLLPYPWNVVDGGAPPVTDPNGIPFNPRWNWQTIAQPALTYPNCPSNGCTTQPTWENPPPQGPFGTVPGTCSANVVGAGGIGHRNWALATYKGALTWGDHSVIDKCSVPNLKAAVHDLLHPSEFPSPDDDYNMTISTPDSNGHASGSTGSNEQVKLEFKAGETVDRYGQSAYWSAFRSDVAECSSNPVEVNGKEAIATGLLGLDLEHSAASELHPVFGLAIHTNSAPDNDVWEIFARNFGNEGFCSSKDVKLQAVSGPNDPVDLTFQLDRPSGAPPSTTPTVATDFKTTPTLEVRLTRLYIGRFADTAFYRAGVTFGEPVASPPSVWDCPRDPQEGFGEFVPFPDGQSSDSTCDPPNSVFTGQDIAALAPVPNRTVYDIPITAGTSQIPVTISFVHPTLSTLSWNWRFSVDTATGGSSFQATQGGVHSETHGSASCARGPDDWMLCWETRLPPPAAPPMTVSAGPGGPAFVTFHLPPPLNGPGGITNSGEIRLNWNGGAAPPPFQPVPGPRPLSAPAIQAAPAAPVGSEEQLLQTAAQLTPQQLAILTALLPTRQPVPVDSIPVPVVMTSGPPPASAAALASSVEDPAQETARLDMLRAFCGALGGQSPTGQGGCTAFAPATVLTNTGTPAPTGWFTTPVTITLTAVDAGGNGIGHTEYSLDDTLWTTYTAPFVAPEGEITIFYRTIDAAGTLEPTQQRSFKIDTRAPSSVASATLGSASAALTYTVSDPAPGSGPAGLFSVSKVGNTSTPDTRFTSGATGTIKLDTLCTDIEYWAQDVAGNLESPHHHIEDSAPPTLTVPADVTTSTCTTSAVVQIGQATATDECVTPAPPAGLVIRSNGVTLSSPLAVVGGQVTLGIGTHTVQWTVTDGVHVVSRTQTVVVGTRIQTSESFLVDDGSSLRSNAGGFAALLNSGTGLTQVGNGARTGEVVSVGPVRVLHRAVVTGNATSASTVFKEPDGTVTGVIAERRAVALPALPGLPTFPSPAAGSFTVDSGAQTRAPGSYVSATVNGGTLTLLAGDYFFRSLTINANVTVRVAPSTRIFVRDALALRSPLRASVGTAIQPTFVGFAGSSFIVEAQLDGTLLAPNAAVSLGVGPGLTFTGSYLARVIEVRPGNDLVCR